MNEDLNDIQYWPIRNYKYAHWFEQVQYNGKTLSDEERKECVAAIDDTIATYSDGLSLAHAILENTNDSPGDLNDIERTIVSIILFVLMTMIDSMVASKYFILADKDYDRRFMRGKLFVILNEGFKKLYGFNENSHKKSEWDRILPLLDKFPETINLQYQELTFHLENHARSSSWWKDERDLEVHLWDAEQLYRSRQEEVIESKVMMDSMRLVSTLLGVNDFLFNAHGCIVNTLIDQYRRGELKE